MNAADVRGAVLLVECPTCKGRKRLPGGRYQAQGEVVNCPICDGHGTIIKRATLEDVRNVARLVLNRKAAK